ncbi:hypothetical protein VIGAN_01323000 [Vigna angularis var. angularis]|uniref:Uncharacterized protein n=1 Tax=Vigna angularis var. angularis TaxID=157739 RepID=A0A0S3R3Y4_PHAAN|nr:hypothetical protein VIGAN_01323000 [Vigna angularis var. angularis]
MLIETTSNTKFKFKNIQHKNGSCETTRNGQEHRIQKWVRTITFISCRPPMKVIITLIPNDGSSFNNVDEDSLLKRLMTQKHED